MTILTLFHNSTYRWPDPEADKAAEMNVTTELHNQLTALQEEVKNIMENLNILLEERANRQHSLDVCFKNLNFFHRPILFL